MAGSIKLQSGSGGSLTLTMPETTEHLTSVWDFTAVKNTNGYTKLPNGLIIQWGLTGTTSDGGTAVTVTFPIAFPTAVVHVSYMKIGDINGTGSGDDRVGTVTLTNFLANAGTLSGNNYFLAIGY